MNVKELELQMWFSVAMGIATFAGILVIAGFAASFAGAGTWIVAGPALLLVVVFFVAKTISAMREFGEALEQE